MSRGVNRVELVGNVGKTPELRKTSTDKSVCTFTLATKEFGGKGKDDHTEWHTVTIWDHQAEFVGNNVGVGDLVRVEGCIRQEKYEKDGVTRYSVKILARDVMLLYSKNFKGGSKKGDDDRDDRGDREERRPAKSASAGKANPYDTDDRPF